MILLIISIIITLVVIVRNTLGKDELSEIHKPSALMISIGSIVAIVGMVIVDYQQGFETKAIHMASTSLLLVVIPFCTMLGKPVKIGKWLLVAIWIVIFIILSHYFAGAMEEIDQALIKFFKAIFGWFIWLYEKGKEWRRSL